MRPYYYRGDDGRMSFCGLTLLRSGAEAMTVLITELPTNPGSRASDIFERLATHLFESRIVFLKAPPERIVWIEHLPAEESADPELSGGTYSQVVLEWDGGKYHSPKRVPLTAEEIKGLRAAGG